MFWNKSFSAHNCVIKNLALLKDPCFLYPTTYCYQMIYLRYEHGQSHSKWNTKKFWRFWLLFLSCLPLYLDHIKSAKSTTSFNQELTKTLTILRINKNFDGKLCMLISFNDITFIAAIFLIVDQLWFKNKKYI